MSVDYYVLGVFPDDLKNIHDLTGSTPLAPIGTKKEVAEMLRSRLGNVDLNPTSDVLSQEFLEPEEEEVIEYQYALVSRDHYCLEIQFAGDKEMCKQVIMLLHSNELEDKGQGRGMISRIAEIFSLRALDVSDGAIYDI